MTGLRRRVVAGLMSVLLATAACSSEGSATRASAGAGPAPAAVRGTITVLAAASLTEAFTTLARRFEAAHPGSTVRLEFGASSTLAQQIDQGVPADVFASASTATMAQVLRSGGAAGSTPFASNVMEIAVPRGNPAHVVDVGDLGRSGVKVALCQPQVPCGTTGRTVFAKAGVTVRPVTLEQDVKATLTKVALGEVDAGVVYVTDVRAAGDKVMGVPIPASVNAATEYPIAMLAHAPNSVGARAFVSFVLGADGQRMLRADGFGAP